MPNRKENNLAIITILHDIVNYNENLRFCQILYIIGILGNEVDTFYEEPWITLNKILNNECFNKINNRGMDLESS